MWPDAPRLRQIAFRNHAKGINNYVTYESIFAVLVLAAVVCIVPLAQATVTVEVTIAGSSAMWQTMALGAYKAAGAGAGHWTSASNAINLTDSRVTPVNVDAGTVWIVS